MTRFFIISNIIVWVLLSTNALAQSGKSNNLGFSLGTSNPHLLDEHASPLIFRGFGFNTSVDYTRETDATRQQAEIAFFYTNTHATPENFETEFYRGKLQLTFVYKLTSKGQNKFQLFTGPSLCSFLAKADYNYKYYGDSYSRAITSWYISHSVDAVVWAEYTINNKNRLSCRLYFPLLSNVSRPQYSPAGDYNYDNNIWDVKYWGTTVFIPKNLKMNLKLNYDRNLSESLKFQAVYEFEYAKYDDPQTVKLYTNNLSIGFIFNF